MRPNDYWRKIAPGLRRYLGLARPTLAEAEQAFQEAKEEPLTDEQVRSIVDYALHKEDV